MDRIRNLEVATMLDGLAALLRAGLPDESVELLRTTTGEREPGRVLRYPHGLVLLAHEPERRSKERRETGCT